MDDIYSNGIDFQDLASHDPDFQPHVKANGQLDFSQAASVKQLSMSLLRRDFALNVDLPDDRLCPPVPNRLTYFLWLRRIIDCVFLEASADEQTVVGLDIGTGSSCIFPLLGCAIQRTWKFAATGKSFLKQTCWRNFAEIARDVDQKNLKYARENVLRNNLGSRVEIFQTHESEKLIPLDKFQLDRIDFTICNPPFYESTASLEASAKAKSRPPFSACTGSEVEMVTPGGEVAFVRRMVEESRELKDRVLWYSTMLGKLSSVTEVVDDLLRANISNWAVTELVQGSRTKRWAVAWSWTGSRPKMSLARAIPSLTKSRLPFPSEFRLKVDEKQDVIMKIADETIRALNIAWHYEPSSLSGKGFAAANVWSRAARRRREGHISSRVPDDDISDIEPALGFRIDVQEHHGVSVGSEVLVHWLIGKDARIFESFCGMLKRTLSLTKAPAG